MNTPIPTKIEVDRPNKLFHIDFDNQGQSEHYSLSFEYLRVNSPSAEVRGHSPEQYTLQYGKQNVGVEKIVEQGSYAICIYFNDGHSTGIYTWEWLYELATTYDVKWPAYLEELQKAGKTRAGLNLLA